MAITPRSFCNGPYFKPFRTFFLNRMALRRVHVFETRGDLFGADGVLQENVIVHAVKGPVAPRATVAISSSETPEDDLHAVSEEPYGRVVVPDDPESFIRVVPDEAGEGSPIALGGSPAASWAWASPSQLGGWWTSACASS